METNMNAVQQVGNAFAAYKNCRDYQEQCDRLIKLILVLRKLLRDEHTVRVQTSRKLHTLKLPIKEFEASISFKYSRTQRVSARDIQHFVIDGTVVFPDRFGARSQYCFEENLAVHSERLWETQRSTKNARIALLRRLALRDQGVFPDANTFRYDYMRPEECSWELAGMSIEGLMEFLDVELVNTVLKPVTR